MDRTKESRRREEKKNFIVTHTKEVVEKSFVVKEREKKSVIKTYVLFAKDAVLIK